MHSGLRPAVSVFLQRKVQAGNEGSAPQDKHLLWTGKKKEKIRTGLIQSGDIPEQTASLPLKAEGFTSVMSDCFLIALICSDPRYSRFPEPHLRHFTGLFPAETRLPPFSLPPVAQTHHQSCVDPSPGVIQRRRFCLGSAISRNIHARNICRTYGTYTLSIPV